GAGDLREPDRRPRRAGANRRRRARPCRHEPRGGLMERIGGAVRSELGRFGTAGAMADLVAAWPGAVGDAVATNAWPARFARDGTLHVAASSSARAFELGQLESEILARLKEALGKAAPRDRKSVV